MGKIYVIVFSVLPPKIKTTVVTRKSKTYLYFQKLPVGVSPGIGKGEKFRNNRTKEPLTESGNKVDFTVKKKNLFSLYNFLYYTALKLSTQFHCGAFWPL
jgi:hypothetical protein